MKTQAAILTGLFLTLNLAAMTSQANARKTNVMNNQVLNQVDNKQLREDNKHIAKSMLRFLEEKDIPSWHKLWNEDAVQEMPFAPKGFPTRLEGKQALLNQYKDLPNNFVSMKFPIESIMTMEDPNIVVFEYRGVIELKTGGTYNNRYIGMLKIKNGKISLFKEYFDPVILNESFGTNLQKNFNTEAKK